MTNVSLVILLLSLVTFTYLNIYQFNAPSLAILDFVYSILVIAAFIYMQISKDVKRTANFTAFLLFSLFISLVYFNYNNDFVLTWSFLFPAFAMTLMGPKNGMITSLFVCFIILGMTYLGINNTEEYFWKMEAMLRYGLTFLTLAYLLYLNESSLKRALEENAKQMKTLNELLKTDSLTQIANRRCGAHTLEREAQIAAQNNTPLHILLFDIDNFKNVNDQYGHNVGDEVLKASATILHLELEENQYICRWGGEEFLIIFTGLKTEDAMRKSQSLCNKLSSHTFEHINHLSASFGLAEFNSPLTNEQLIANADKALYEAKKRGKNRVVLYTEPQQECLNLTTASQASQPQ